MAFSFCAGCCRTPSTAYVTNFRPFHRNGSQPLLSVSSVRCKGQQCGVQLQCEGSCWRGCSFPPSLHLPTKGREGGCFNTKRGSPWASFLGSAGSPGVPLGERGCWGPRREVHSRAICSGPQDPWVHSQAICSGPQDPSPSSFSNTSELSNCLFISHTESNFSQGKAGLNFQNTRHLSCFSLLPPRSPSPP